MPDGEDKRELGSEVLRGVGHVVLPILLTAGGLVGFVALAGGAVVWTRFSAAEVPPDQVVAVYPRAELVAIASALLLLFGLVGLLAVALCYLIEPKGRASLGMTRVLFTVMGVEGLVVILLIAEARSWQQRIIAAELFVLAIFACLCATSLYEKPELREGGSDEANLRALRVRFLKRMIATAAAVLILVLVTVVFRSFDAKLVIACLALCSAPAFWLAWTLRDGSQRPRRRQLERFQVPFTRNGMAWIICLTVAAVALPAVILKSAWLLLSLAVAAFLFAALWRAAVMPKGGFLWYGVAVFVSVPLFGTLTWMVQNVFEPQVQPMALIRKAGGVDEYLQGLYVTETDDRVYFATVATKGCSKHLVPGSGRLLSVPKSEIATIAIGPLQSVTRARKTALEMSYALAPSAGIQAPQVGPAREGKGALARVQNRVRDHRLENVAAAVEPDFGAGLRLAPESAAPGQIVTLRMSAPSGETRGFGRSRHHRTLRVDGVPVNVAREQAQTPWEAEYVETGDGKVLKLGKQIVYNRVGGVYNAISRYDNAGEHPLFVRLSDRSVIAVRVYSRSRHAYTLTSTSYLRLRRRRNAPVRLSEEAGHPPEVTLRNGETVSLKAPLLRQNWHEDHIKFRLPEGARTGRVTIDCDQLANQPYLRVTDPSQAPRGRRR